MIRNEYAQHVHLGRNHWRTLSPLWFFVNLTSHYRFRCNFSCIRQYHYTFKKSNNVLHSYTLSSSGWCEVSLHFHVIQVTKNRFDGTLGSLRLTFKKEYKGFSVKPETQNLDSISSIPSARILKALDTHSGDNSQWWNYRRYFFRDFNNYQSFYYPHFSHFPSPFYTSVCLDLQEQAIFSSSFLYCHLLYVYI